MASTRWSKSLAVIVGAAWAAAAMAQEGSEAKTVVPSAERFRVAPARSEIVVDGALDEPAWRAVQPIPLRYEWLPGDNSEPPVRTEAFLTFDASRLYVGFRAYDPEPSQIRAHLMDRDAILTFVQDDHVTLMIDPFNDERRAFQFRINPLGVQADAIFSEVETVEDFSWDLIWQSAGRITEEGYEVEMAIPVNQLRFPAGESEQTWGVELGRSYPRSRRHRIAANPRDRNNNCVLCQINKVTGFRDLEPGRNLEVDPTLTATRNDTLDDFPDGDLDTGQEDLEPGLTVRWGVTPALTFSGTLNPDFSQVEADAAQLEVNERFALFYPEKRPFFLEGVDLFSTPLRAVFTRTVVDPDWGLKMTGKHGKNVGGAFITSDTVNAVIIPSNQGSRSALLEEEIQAGVFRYRRDIGPSSTLGVLYAGREGDAYHNRVGGVDGFLRLSPSDEVRFQYLRSDTRYPEAVALELDQPLGSFAGDALRIDYDHNARLWGWSLLYEDLDRGFRADSGFIPRVDIRGMEGTLTRTFWGEADDWLSSWAAGLAYSRYDDQSGQLSDESLGLDLTFFGPRQSVAQLTVSETSTFYDGILHESLGQIESYLEVQPHALGKYSLFARIGETVDFANNRPAEVLLLNPAIELKPGRHVNAQLSHVFQRLEIDAGELSEANLSELRLVYNLNVRTFVRATFQFLSLEQRPDLFNVEVEESVETLFTQLLFSYKLNPRTVLFVGYSDNHLGGDPVDLTRTDRTFFAKLGYAFLL